MQNLISKFKKTINKMEKYEKTNNMFVIRRSNTISLPENGITNTQKTQNLEEMTIQIEHEGKNNYLPFKNFPYNK